MTKKLRIYIKTCLTFVVVMITNQNFNNVHKFFQASVFTIFRLKNILGPGSTELGEWVSALHVSVPLLRRLPLLQPLSEEVADVFLRRLFSPQWYQHQNQLIML